MNLAQLDRRIGDNPAAKELVRRLIKKPEGFKMDQKQAERQCCSARLLEIGFAMWEGDRLILSPQVRDEL